MVTAMVARSQLYFAFMKSKSGPDVASSDYPVFKGPATL